MNKPNSILPCYEPIPDVLVKALTRYVLLNA